MVSTRGVRFKFSEGERVLCYEPDPTKAKVLYDSKVLEVIENKDKRGRRTVEYLIHFQGWNSSWDRCVSEDFVLKDTEENRQLQRDLAEKSQLQLGAYLYRRERKKGPASTSTSTSAGAGPGPAKRARHTFDDDGSSSSTQPDEGEAGDTDSSSASGSGAVQAGTPPPQPPISTGRAHIVLPSALRDRLTFDYHLVVKRGRLSRLPASPCVADILEAFVRWYARAGAWHAPARPRAEPAQKPDLLDVSSKLNVVREVADGLRVYFDFVLRSHLLYKQEISQYHDICGVYIDKLDGKIKDEIKEEAMSGEEEEAAEVDLKSPKIPEYAHLPPDPDNAQESSSEPMDDKNDSDDKPLSQSITKADREGQPEQCCHASAALDKEKEKEKEQHTVVRPAGVARRLRSQNKVSLSHSEPDEPAPSTSAAEPRNFEQFSSSVGSSGSSTSEGWASRAAAGSCPPAAAPSTSASTTASNGRTKLSQLFDMVAKWQIVPREDTDHLPCRIYGAIHFARLFVKLPDFLNATQMPDMKLKMILKYIDMFVQYLNEHSEWFGEVYYVADSASRSR